MKPCSNNRKLITWMAVGALDARAQQTLRTHLKTCEGCQRYLHEISFVTQTLAATKPEPDIQTSESFHRKVVGGLRGEQALSLRGFVAAQLRYVVLHWQVALPVLGATTVVTLSLLVWRPHVRPPSRDQVAVVMNVKSDLDPTISNYRTVANRSLEKLDELLTQQGNRNPSAALIYTASTLARADAPN